MTGIFEQLSGQTRRFRRRFRLRFALAGATLLFGTSLASAQSGPQEPVDAPDVSLAESTLDERVRQLIVDLGDPKFQRREAAGAELLRIGSPALLRLHRAREGADPEVRQRSDALYLRVVRQDYQARISLFEDGKIAEAGISTWGVFAERFGDSPVNRKLFANMLRASPELMIQLEGGRQQLPKMLAEWLKKENMSGSVFGSPRFSVGSVSALAFCGIESPVSDSSVNAVVFSTFRHDPRIGQAAKESQHAPTMQKLLVALVGREERATAAALVCCFDFGFRDTGLAKASAVMKKADAQTDVVVAAMLVFARFGAQPERQRLEAFIDDNTPFGAFRYQDERISTTLGDIALALVWKMHQQDPAEMGFNKDVNNDANIINVQLAGFVTEENRLAAHAKWDVFRKRTN
jgi:hypothetical protein